MRFCKCLLVASVALPAVAQQLLLPVDPYNVTGYQFAELHGDPTQRHLGEDAHATIGVGTPIKAIADGVIITSKTDTHPRGYGQYVVISHSFPLPFVSIYGHLSRQLQYPLRGVGSVKKNDIIGYVGSQDENGGWSPHLHFSIYKSAPDGQYHYWGNAPNTSGDDVDVDAQGYVVGGLFTKPSTFIANNQSATGAITYNLSNVLFEGGFTATGSFAFDASTGIVSNVNIHVSGPSTGFYGFTSGGPVLFDSEAKIPSDRIPGEPFTSVFCQQSRGCAIGNLNLNSYQSLNSSSPTALATTGVYASILEINAVVGYPGYPWNILLPLSSASAALVPATINP